MAHFQLALDLPHAATVAGRIRRVLVAVDRSLLRLAAELCEVLHDSHERGENPPQPLAFEIRDQAAALGRRLVDEIESRQLQSDRLGQSVRNLFECLTYGEEGARLSLRAGESPDSLQRPVGK